MNHFSYPLNIVQINIFEEPQNIFSQPKSQTPNYRAAPPPVFLTIEGPLPPWAFWCYPGYDICLSVLLILFLEYKVLFLLQ